MVWLEADRTGWFLSTMDSAKVDLQRDVVKNERRQSVENQPYGLADETLLRSLYPATTRTPGPSSARWPTFRCFGRRRPTILPRFYAPNNTTIVVAGDVDRAEVRRLVRRLLRADSPRACGRPARPPASLARDTATVLQDRVQLPRLYYMWHTVKRGHTDEAPLKVLRLHPQRSQEQPPRQTTGLSGAAGNRGQRQPGSKRLDGDFTIIVSGRPNEALPKLQRVVDRELAPPDSRWAQSPGASAGQELHRGPFSRVHLETVAGKAEALNVYLYELGQADAFQLELDRFER